MTSRRFASHAEADAADLAYWMAIPEAERVLQVWRLSLAQYGQTGMGTMAPDFVDLLRAFAEADVRYLVVGAYALGLHGRPRATGDLDVWVEANPENAVRVMHALAAFGAPLTDVTSEDFSREGITYQIGLPPLRIDILTQLTGLSFAEAWPEHVKAPLGDIEADFIGREAFVRNKRATGRLKDLGDIEGLA